MSLIEKLEDLDDVQRVASNLSLTDEVAAALVPPSPATRVRCAPCQAAHRRRWAA